MNETKKFNENKVRKMTFTAATEYNGVIYKKGMIGFSTTLLEKLGITERNPNVIVSYDKENNCIIIKSK